MEQASVLPDPNNVTALFEWVLDAIENKQWWPLAALAIIILTLFTRWLVPKIHGRFGAWLKTDRGGVALVIFYAVMGALSTTFAAWKTPNVKLLLTAVFTAVGSAGGFTLVKKLFFPSDKPKEIPMSTEPAQTVIGKDPPPPIRPGMFLPFLFIGSLFLSGCGCWTAEKKDDPKCIVARESVDCTVDSLKGLAPSLFANLLAMVTGSLPDWGAFGDKAAELGLKNGGCILAELEENFMKPAGPVGVVKAAGAHVALDHLKAKFGASSVKFCVTKYDGQKVCR